MNPQDILNNVTGLLQNAQQASAQAQTHQHEISQALTAAVHELTQAVRALTAAVEASKPVALGDSCAHQGPMPTTTLYAVSTTSGRFVQR